ncbi:MAG TPA: hypothetical protein ENL06_02030 [Candidatus Portnoybacteria bacterium]|nr:hypothetical protein [Candidatus Portnoybacteria bacterium]
MFFLISLISIIPVSCQNSPCGMCDLFKGISNLINFFVFQVGPIAAGLMILIGGAMWVANGGNQDQIKKGQDIIKSTIIGLIVMYSAWMIVNTIITTLATGPAGQGIRTNWYSFTCQPKDNNL